MRHVLTPLLLAAALVAGGCDEQRASKLEEGVSTEYDVRHQFGEPAQVVERPDGSKVFSYPRQPEGTTNYEIAIGPDGKMSSLRQLLTPANFAKVQPGMYQGDVRRLLGRQAKSVFYATKPDEEVWQWRFVQGQTPKVFEVTFDRDRKVLATATVDDERHTLPAK
ncbi:outer membrane protein assembly factor BamE [Ramlibacter sp. XY19]|uniref:outer membrane protein assembly factor BamE n=1 Tax=Ramlibacter paludis TaxID=2908000 RepID=UPI0023DA728D|nr:outer membrane protein assembly factor BamE [Ramlibacter paludis]MCG2592914.1 outer membrane protein assembly factor BamE [Ramlibacter paludis]